jgi:hypothetical protein
MTSFAGGSGFTDHPLGGSQARLTSPFQGMTPDPSWATLAVRLFWPQSRRRSRVERPGSRGAVARPSVASPFRHSFRLRGAKARPPLCNMRDRPLRLGQQAHRPLSNSSGYFLGLVIAEASPSTRTEPGSGASTIPQRGSQVRLAPFPLEGEGVSVTTDV